MEGDDLEWSSGFVLMNKDELKERLDALIRERQVLYSRQGLWSLEELSRFTELLREITEVSGELADVSEGRLSDNDN